jgi:hypothetical protein
VQSNQRLTYPKSNDRQKTKSLEKKPSSSLRNKRNTPM